MSTTPAAPVKLRTRSKEFDSGKKLTIQVLGGIEGVTLAQKLAQTFIPAYKKLFVDAKTFNAINIIEAAIGGLAEIELTKIINRLLADATVNDFPLNVDNYFAANYGELVDFLAFALEENFGSFFHNEISKQLAGE